MDDRRVALEADAIAYRPSSVVDGIAALVDKSLLRQESGPAGEPRFVMLETIREFALEQLDALAEADALRRRHALFFLDLAEAAEQQARGPDQLPAIERLSAEHENLRAALRWAIAHGEAAVAIRLSGALGWFWDTRSYLSEGRRWLAAALAAGDAPPDHRARALTSAGLLAGDQNDFAAARELFDQGLALYHAAADQRGAAYALSYLGRMLRCQGEYPAAQERLDEALALFQAIGDRRGAAYASYNLGRVTYQQGDFEAAQRMFATGLALFAAAGDTWGQALAHANLGRVAYRRGDYAAARAAQERGLALFEQVGDTWGQALAHCKLGWAAYRQGDRAARAHFTESLSRASRAQYAEGIADALAGLGALALENRQWQRAARLLAASDGLRAAVGDVLHTTDDLADDRWLVSLRRQLGRPAFEAAWRAGQSAPVEQILAEALS